MNLSLLFIIASIVVFVFAAFAAAGVGAVSYPVLVAAGLACFAAGHLPI